MELIWEMMGMTDRNNGYAVLIVKIAAAADRCWIWIEVLRHPCLKNPTGLQIMDSCCHVNRMQLFQYPYLLHPSTACSSSVPWYLLLKGLEGGLAIAFSLPSDYVQLPWCGYPIKNGPTQWAIIAWLRAPHTSTQPCHSICRHGEGCIAISFALHLITFSFADAMDL
jgi:hypothetical protein